MWSERNRLFQFFPALPKFLVASTDGNKFPANIVSPVTCKAPVMSIVAFPHVRAAVLLYWRYPPPACIAVN
jgi:hypothetical protein